MNGSLMVRLVEPGSFRVAFQPIVDLRSGQPEVCAVEGLTRGPRGTNFESPDILFEYARRLRNEALLDRVAIATILAEAGRLSPDLGVQINVHASTIVADPGLAPFLKGLCASSGVALRRLTLEIIEQSNPIDEPCFLVALERLRDLGVGIALDDIGVGTSNFRMALLARPSMLKADRSLVDGVADEPYKRAALTAIQILARQAGAAVVAEGVENARDLAALQDLRIELAQGYYFSRPLSPDASLGLVSGLPLPSPCPALVETPPLLAAAG